MEVIVNEHEASPEGELVYDRSAPSGELSDKDPIIEDVIALLKGHDLLDETMEMGVRLAMDEGLVNAMRHGNKLSADKIAGAKVYMRDEDYTILIWDQGEGFEPYDVPDPDDEESLFLEHGRGVLIMKNYFNVVDYYNGGRQLLLVKNR